MRTMNFSKAEAQIVASLERAEIKAVPPDMAYHERCGICGCGYGAKGYATPDEACRMARLLSLQPGRRILDVGAGTGWPGLYFAKETGCEVVLVDLPLGELRAAYRRAVQDRISDRC